MTNPDHPFVDLPAGLVDEVLETMTGVGDVLVKAFKEAQASRGSQRSSLLGSGLLRKDSELGYRTESGG